MLAPYVPDRHGARSAADPSSPAVRGATVGPPSIAPAACRAAGATPHVSSRVAGIRRRGFHVSPQLPAQAAGAAPHVPRRGMARGALPRLSAVAGTRPPRSSPVPPARPSAPRWMAGPDVRPRDDLRGRRGRCSAGLGRGRHPAGAARVHGRRPGRQGGARGARARAGGDRQLGLRVPAPAHHGQPRAGVPAQGRSGVRPAAGGRAARGVLPARTRRDRGLRGRRGTVADRRGAGDPRRARRRGRRPAHGAAADRAPALTGTRSGARAGHPGARDRLAAGAGRDPARRRGGAVDARRRA